MLESKPRTKKRNCKKNMKHLLVNIFVLVIALGFTACGKKTQDKPIVLNPELVFAGKPVTISYDDSKTNLVGKDSINAVFYYCSDFVWNALDVKLEKKQGLWKGTVDVPDSADLVAFKFVSGLDEDIAEGMASYVQLTMNNDTVNPPGAYMSWCLLRAPHFESYSIPGYITDSAQIDTKETFFYWVNQELKIYPEERKDIGYIAAKAIKLNGKGTGNNIIRDDINLILSLDSAGEASDMDLYHAAQMADIYEPGGMWASEIRKLSESKFPNGIVARDNEIWRIFRLADIKEKEEAMAAYVKRFPYEQWKDVHTYNSEDYLGKNFQSVIYNQIINNNNYKLAEEYLHEVPYTNLISSFWHMIQIPHMKEMLPADKLLPIADMLMGEIFGRERTQEDLVYSPNEWTKHILKQQKDAIVDYADILNETGSADKALIWIEKVAPYFDGSSTKFSDLYITLLDKNAHSDKVEDVILKGIAANSISPEMITRLKSIYVDKNGSEDGFDVYFNKLKPQSVIEKEHAEIKKSFINKDIELYSYETLGGDTMDMASLKGKILILDFWATWCVPCKAAMPGMNMAYQKYKDDDDVKFFFVSTMEFNKDFKSQIKQFLKDKGYEFTVLLDMMNPETHKGDYAYSHYAKEFGFSGIPQKIIIDGNGKLRWRSTGYDGSPSALADKISFIIQELKKES